MTALPAKARLLTLVVILSNLIGNTLLSFGMRGATGLAALLSPSVLGGVALLILWTLTRTTLLSWADLSYVLPVTAIGYVLTLVTSMLFLHETISPMRWAATLLVVVGVILAATTPAQTTHGNEPR
jgi:uncharacterized membrane protein